MKITPPGGLPTTTGSGAPTSTPAAGSLYYDYTNNTFYAYSGSAWVVTGGPSMAMVPNGRLFVPPAYYNSGSDQAYQLNATTDSVGMRFIAECDYLVDRPAVYITDVGTAGNLVARIYSDDATNVVPSAALGSAANVVCSAADTWVRASSGLNCQLTRGTTYWLVLTPATGTVDVSVSVRRWNTSLGSMFPDAHLVTRFSDDSWSTASNCTQDSKPACLNAVINGGVYYTPPLMYGRYNGRHIYIPGSGVMAIPEAGISYDLNGLTEGTVYNLWIYNNSGTLTLNASTTATALSEGILVKAGATTWRYLGTIVPKEITAVAATREGPVDVMDSRLVMNHYNKMPKVFGKPNPYAANTSDPPTGTEGWNGSATEWKIEGLFDGTSPISLFANIHSWDLEDGDIVKTNIAIDSTSAAPLYGQQSYARNDNAEKTVNNLTARMDTVPSTGYHYFLPLQTSAAGSPDLVFFWTNPLASFSGLIFC